MANDSFAPDFEETLTIVAVGTTSNGGTVIMAPDAKSLTYTPAPAFVGAETFTYTINDGTPGSNASATVTVTV